MTNSKEDPHGSERRQCFSPKQIEILQYLIDGISSNVRIGDTMNLSHNTVASYKTKILSSIEDIIGERSMFAAVKFAVKEDLIKVKELRMPKKKLTPSELRILTLMVDINTFQVLCERLDVSSEVVTKHLSGIRKKFGVSNNYALVAIAITLASRVLLGQNLEGI